MVVRKLEDKDLINAKKLWKQAFGDSDRYIDYNFSANLDLKNSLAIFIDDRLACMLFMLPKKISIDDKKMDTFFIAGVATDLDFRYQGYAKSLMAHAHEVLKNSGFSFVFLYPFNHDFYRKLGYQTVSHIKNVTFNTKSENAKTPDYDLTIYDASSNGVASRLNGIYNAYIKKFDSYFVRNEDTFDALLKTMRVENGQVAIITRNHIDVGYSIYYEIDGKADCVESVFLNRKAVKAFVNAMTCDGFVYCDKDYDVKSSEIEEYAMVKLLGKEYACLTDHQILILEQY